MCFFFLSPFTFPWNTFFPCHALICHGKQSFDGWHRVKWAHDLAKLFTFSGPFSVRFLYFLPFANSIWLLLTLEEEPPSWLIALPVLKIVLRRAPILPGWPGMDDEHSRPFFHIFTATRGTHGLQHCWFKTVLVRDSVREVPAAPAGMINYYDW